MRISTGLRILVVGVASLTPFGQAFAWPDKVQGEPAAFSAPPAAEGVYIWVSDDDRLSVRTQGDRKYQLTFSLHYGEISDLRLHGLDQNDRFERNETKEQLFLTINGSDALEGLDFSTSGNRVEVSCKVSGGDPCPLEEIYLGSDGANPSKLPFTINRKDD